MKNDIKSRLSLAFLWFFSFVIIIFMMCFSVHAEEPYFPMFQNNNGNFTDADITYIENYYNSDDNYIFVYFSGYAPGYGSRMKNFQVISIPKEHSEMIYGEVLSNGFQFNIYSVGSLAGNQFDFLQILDQGWYYHYSSNINNFQNLNSSNYDTSIDFVSNFRLFSSNSENADTILKYGSDPNPPLDIGVAIIPPEPILPFYPTGTNPPSQVPPTYTTTDYSWTTPPSFDGSSVENALGSIQNLIGWLANNLKEEFKNTTNNLKGLFKYIGDTIQYYGNAIISTLNNFIQNFYDNMKSLVEPIYNKFEYFTEPLDLEEVETALSSSTTYSLVNSANTLKNTYHDYFDSITAPSSLAFHIPYTILTKSGFIDFDFSWYSDIRDSVLPWIVGFLYMGFGLALFRSFPSIIHGVSGVLQKGG